MTPRRIALLLSFAALLLATTGCIRGIAEDSVRKSLPKLIGPADKYEVKIENTPDGRLMAGDIEDLSIVGTRVRTKDGLVLDKLVVKMHRLKVDTGKKSIKSVEKATFDIDIKQEDLSAMAQQRVHGFGTPQVLLATNSVSVVLPAKLLVTSMDSTLHGVLAVEDGQRVSFIPDRLTIGIIPVPDLLVSAAVGRVNPLADLRSLPVPVQIDSLTTDSGLMNVKGRLFVATGASAAVPNPTPTPTPPAVPRVTPPTPHTAPTSSPEF